MKTQINLSILRVTVIVSGFILKALFINAQKSTSVYPRPTVLLIGTSHLDTQWQWDIQTTINQYVPSVMQDNFKLF